MPQHDVEDQAEAEYRELQKDEWKDEGEDPESFPSGDTVETDRRDASRAHEPDRMPTPEEEEAAERGTVDPEVAQAYEEAAERGASQKGEGRVP